MKNKTADQPPAGTTAAARNLRAPKWLILAFMVVPLPVAAAPAVDVSPASDSLSPTDGGADSAGTVRREGADGGASVQSGTVTRDRPKIEAPPPATMPPVSPGPPHGPPTPSVAQTPPPGAASPQARVPFEIRIGGLLQVEYLGRATEGHLARRLSDMPAPLGVAPPNSPPTPFLDESTLILRRARLSAAGFVATPRLGYFLEMDAGQGDLALLEYRLRARLGHGLSLNVGQMRVPFSRSWSIREDRLLFTERSIATDQFRYDYDIGISVDESWLDDRLVLSLGGFNGGGRVLAKNDNLDPMLALRIEATPVGAVEEASIEGPTEGFDAASVVIGAAISADYVPTPPSYGYLSGDPQAPRQLVIDANADGLPDGITVLQAEIDLRATYRRFAAEAEGYYRHEAWHDIPVLQSSPSTPFSPRTSYVGFFLQMFQSFAVNQTLAGARFSFSQLSPLSPGYQRYGQYSCLTSSGVNYGCNLPYADEQVELSATIVERLIPRVLQVSGMYSFLYWRSDGTKGPIDPIEHRAIVVVQLSY